MLQIRDLNKSFGANQVLYDINLTADNGKILGLIGKNGSGKTTLFHSILNFVTYRGNILIDNHPFTTKDYDSIGYLPEERSLMPKQTVKSQVKFLAGLKDMTPKEVDKMLPSWMGRLGVKGDLDDKIKNLSKGNQQKIQMIATLIHEPNLIILDEPFSGLDPVNVEIMKQVILLQKKRGATIIFSDHNMKNVEELCDEIVMINDGHIVINGAINEIRNSYGLTRLFVRTNRNKLDDLPGVSKIQLLNDGSYKLTLSDEKYGPEIFKILSNGEYLQTFDQEPPTLEEIFVEKVGAHHA